MTPSLIPSAPPPPRLQCTKKAYAKREAETICNIRLRGRGRPEILRIYQCTRCNRWHLTHQEQESA